MRDLAFDIRANDRTGQIFDQIKAKAEGSFRNVDAAIQRLNRQFDDGYSRSDRFARGLATIDRALAQNKIGMNEAERLIASMTTRLGTSVNASDLAAKGQDRLAAAVRGANASIAAQEAQLEQATRAARQFQAVNDNETAFRRRNLAYQAFDVGQGLAMGAPLGMVAVQQGPQIAQMYAGAGGLRAALSDSIGLVAGLARGLWPVALAAGAGAAALGEMRDQIEDATGKTVNFGEVAKGVFGVIADDISTLLQPAIDAIGPPIQYAFEQLGSAAVDLAEWVVNAFRAAASDIAFIWEQLPNIAGAAAVGAMNAVTSATLSTIETVSDYVDSWIETVNAALAKLNEYTGQDWRIPSIGFDAGGAAMPNDFYDDLRKANEEHRRRIEEILGSNPLRDYFGSVRDRVAGRIGEQNAEGSDAWAGMRDTDRAAVQEMRDQQRAMESAMREADRAILDQRQSFRGLADDIRQVIEAGGDLSDVLRTIGLRLADSLFDTGIDKLSELLFPTSKDPGGAGGGLNAIIGSLFGSVARRPANDNAAAGDVMRDMARDVFAAPVEAVTRAPLGEINSAVGGLRYINEGATRNLRLTESLEATIREAVGSVYGQGAYASVYSGGQPGIGSGLPRVGSTRHDFGHAGDLRIFDPMGRQITGDALGPLAQFWQAKGYGGTGLEIRGGGIHLDEHADRAPFWSYGNMTSGQRSAIEAGQKGMFPELASSATKATDAIESMATSSIGATKGLGTFGQSLMSMFPSAPGAPGFNFASLLGGGSTNLITGLLSGFNPLGPMTGLFARGGVFDMGNVVPFADGGVVGSPTLFPMSSGRTGMMGEAGPEAIVPLARGRDGRLGVRMGGGGAGTGGPVEVHVVSRFDADGGFETKVEKVVTKRAPGIARQQAAGVVGEYDHRMGKGGSARQSQSYNHLRSGTRYG